MSPRRGIPPQKKKHTLPRWLVVGSIIVTITFIVVVVVDFWSKIQPPPASSSSSEMTANSRTVGSPNATISFTEFSDFQ